MTDDYETYKCKTLIQMLIKRQQNPVMALEIYNRMIFDEAMKGLNLKEEVINGN
jgi:hypothetical protein